MTINTAQIQSALRPGLKALFGMAPQYPEEWPEIYETYDSDKAFEIEWEYKFTGPAQLTAEGAPSPNDTMGQRIQTQYLHRAVSLQVTITRQAMEDNLYKDKFPMMMKSLRNSMDQAKEILAAAPLNNGFDAAYVIGDGQPIYSLNHPIDGGVYANRPVVYADLNEASLESAIVTVSTFKDQAGLLAKTNIRKLIVPPQGQFIASRLLNSEFRINTANNDRSAIYTMDAVPDGYRVNHYLNLPNAWYAITDANDGFKHYSRIPLEADMYTDFGTQNLMARSYARYSFGISNPRGTYGSQGA